MPNTPTILTIRISGKAMGTIEGSELSSDAVKYDGGTQGAHDALAALNAARGSRKGRGWTYTLDVTPAGAEVIENYCRTVGETFTQYDTEPETRREGQALLKVADHIHGQLEGLAMSAAVIDADAELAEVVELRTDPPCPVTTLGICQWFAKCWNDATHIKPHPILGGVPCCDRCAQIGGDR